MDVLSSVRHSIHNSTASTSYKTQYDNPSLKILAPENSKINKHRDKQANRKTQCKLKQ